MLADVYNQLVIFLANSLGGFNIGDLALFWVHGFAILGTLSLAVLPFYLVYRFARWLS